MMNSQDKSQSPNIEDIRDEIIPKQQQLLTLYESIRSDYVSLFQHLYEIDSEAVGSLDDKIVRGITFKETKINDMLSYYQITLQPGEMEGVSEEELEMACKEISPR